MPKQEVNRRPIPARSNRWAILFAAWLARSSITPNQISLASIGFALLGAGLLAAYPTSPFAFIVCALCVLARLLCNLLDGMVAIEGGKQTATGALYNELPDRISDTVFIVALGYAACVPSIGWLGAMAAVGTAYVRTLGGSLGLAQDFRGPMAKQQRMAVVVLACLLSVIELPYLGSHWALQAGAVIITVGSFVTCVTRTMAIAARLRAQ